MLCVLSLLAASSGCGGSSEVHVEHAPAPKEKPPEPEQEPPAAAEPPSTDQAAEASPPAADTPPPAAPPVATDSAASPMPDDVDGGEISRATVIAVLSQGIGRFLQRVRAEAVLEGGRFIGWRITGFDATTAAMRQNALRVGDVVLRVNNQSIERPEQFKSVWDSMATESQLVLVVKRAGKQGQIRYRITD
jgi:hypothetical protein